MNKLKKALALLLCLVIVLSLSGCGRFEMSLLKGAKNMAKLSSFHVDLSLSAQCMVGLPTGEVSMDAGFSGGIDFEREPLRVMAESAFSALGISGTVYSYGEYADGDLVLSASLDGQNWTSAVTEDFSLPSGGLMTAAAAGAAKYLGSFQKTGEEQMGGRDAQRYEGSLSGADIKEILRVTGAEEELGEDFDISAISDDCSLPMSIWLCKKTGMILGIDAELSQLLDVFAAASMEKLTGMDAGAELRVASAPLSIRFTQFDSVAPIARPAV